MLVLITTPPGRRQPYLPIASGGIGIRSSIQLAPSAFLASAAGSFTLVYQTLPDRLAKVPYQAKEDALNEWTRVTDCDPPTSPDDKKQKAWDTPCIQTTLNTLLRTSIDDTTISLAVVDEKSRLLRRIDLAA